MKAQRRRFVVEVKRGTNRSSFISLDSAADKFSTAEDALFGPREELSEPERPVVPAAKAASAMGRVLRDLQEPPPPPLPESPPPARRGRKPGSKNKPKTVLVAAEPPGAIPVRLRVLADAPSPRPVGFASVPEVSAADPARAATTPSAAGTVSASRRSRLRDRSTILKRYVLGIEPAPGQTGWIRSRRARRQD